MIRQMIRHIIFAATVGLPGLSPGLALAGERDALLADYATQARQADPAFSGFSATRGEQFYRNRWAAGDERTPSCASCHGDDPARAGRNAKTGRPIDPIAVSASPDRFTNHSRVEKHFVRDCKSVLGRECTALEKGDYLSFMVTR